MRRARADVAGEQPVARRSSACSSACIANRRARSSQTLVAGHRMRLEERVAVAGGAVTEPGPCASGPARQVSSAPASSRSSGIRSAIVATIPAAPWHHCTRVTVSPTTGGQLPSPPSTCAYRRRIGSTRSRSSSSETKAAQRVHVAGEPVRRAEVLRRCRRASASRARRRPTRPRARQRSRPPRRRSR